MTNVLILNGSPRGKEGNTAKLVDNFVTGLKRGNSDFIFENIQLKDKDIKNCTGCFACWKEKSGECVYDDDMQNLLPKYIDADLMIWATPLYHYGMTSIMKRFVERTLPINKPKIIEKEDTYTHPQRYDMKNRKNILISTCGFPDHSNFDLLIQQFEKITGDNLDEKICSVMGELLSIKILQDEISWYLDAVERAGEEFAQEGAISDNTKKTLNKKLVPVEDFIEMANASWEEGGPPRE